MKTTERVLSTVSAVLLLVGMLAVGTVFGTAAPLPVFTDEAAGMRYYAVDNGSLLVPDVSLNNGGNLTDWSAEAPYVLRNDTDSDIDTYIDTFTGSDKQTRTAIACPAGAKLYYKLTVTGNTAVVQPKAENGDVEHLLTTTCTGKALEATNYGITEGSYEGVLEVESIWGGASGGLRVILRPHSSLTLTAMQFVNGEVIEEPFEGSVIYKNEAGGKQYRTVKNGSLLVPDVSLNNGGNLTDWSAEAPYVLRNDTDSDIDTYIDTFTGSDKQTRTAIACPAGAKLYYKLTVTGNTAVVQPKAENGDVEHLLTTTCTGKALEATNYGITEGSYEGVLEVESIWGGASGGLRVILRPHSSLTLTALQFVNEEEYVPEQPEQPEKPVKKVLKDLLPKNADGFSGELGEAGALLTFEDGKVLLTVREGKEGAATVAYFDYKALGEKDKFLLCYDFTVKGGTASVTLCAGMNGEEKSRTFANGETSLNLTERIAEVAGIEPVMNGNLALLQLPEGSYQGVLDLSDVIPESFKTEGYAWWTTSLGSADMEIELRELSFASGVEASPKAEKPGNPEEPVPAGEAAPAAVAVAAVLSAAALAAAYRKKH